MAQGGKSRDSKMGRLIVVNATWDEEARVWVAESNDLPGLITEAESLDILVKKLPGMIEDLMEANYAETGLIYPFDLVAHGANRAHAA